MLSGRGNRRQYYVQEGTKSMQNEKNITIQSFFSYYPWNHENDIISTCTTYHDSHMRKQDIIHQNAKQLMKTV